MGTAPAQWEREKEKRQNEQKNAKQLKSFTSGYIHTIEGKNKNKSDIDFWHVQDETHQDKVDMETYKKQLTTSRGKKMPCSGVSKRLEKKIASIKSMPERWLWWWSLMNLRRNLASEADPVVANSERNTSGKYTEESQSRKNPEV